MTTSGDIKQQLDSEGFAIVEKVFSDDQIESILTIISQADASSPTFRKTNDLFAIRQFFREIPAVITRVFTPLLQNLLTKLFGADYFVVKSIYFDKPGNSNWFVSYHQDLTISVDKKMEQSGYGPWTTKPGQFAVQPPVEILQDNFTIRIHLDDTNADNGAIKVIPGSHLKGIYRPENIDWSIEKESVCSVTRGGVMIMKPLLLHSSGRTKVDAKRRVLHIEFSRTILPDNLHWAERLADA